MSKVSPGCGFGFVKETIDAVSLIPGPVIFLFIPIVPETHVTVKVYTPVNPDVGAPTPSSPDAIVKALFSPIATL